MMDKNRIRDAIDARVAAEGCEIVEVELTDKNGASVLTVYIDRLPGGVSLDDCERVHYAIDPILDEMDPSSGKPYTLNVSSPGLDRPFKTPRDYERNYGKGVEIKLYAPLMGRKTLAGTLVSVTESLLFFEDEKGGTQQLERNKIALVRPLVKFE
ncbi:MAG: ribosome maturation factor RimP [Clostridiales bacterium]|jgi:ribosome maturation factor RimP|nr:ribosome maturation factor RimP [Clostridiales bacterium]